MKNFISSNWHGISDDIGSRSYVCGYCSHSIASAKGFFGQATNRPGGKATLYIFICHYCHQPTYFDHQNNQFPGAPYGNNVDSLPEDIKNLYNEARNCVSCNSFTGAVLCCRKLLMNIAVSKKAAKGLKFIEYVEYLSSKGFVPPDGKNWVDHIRKKGNEATHEIKIMEKEDAEDLIDFIEMLLKFIYEFPEIINKKSPKNNTPEETQEK